MSERDLHADVVTEVQQQVVRPACLAEMAFPTGTVRIWTGQGEISWNSQTWTGTGKFVSFSAFSEQTDGSANGVKITFSGVDSDLISDAVEDAFQGDNVSIWIAFLNSSGAIVGTPFKFFGGLMDTGEIRDDGQKASIIINAESRLIDQLRPIQHRYTEQDQQKLYAGDKGFEFISTIPDRQFLWRS